MELLARRARNGALVIVVLHDLGVAARYCDRLLLLSGGALVAEGAPKAVLTAEVLAKVYGVRAWAGEADGRPLIVPLERVV
jgi:iron complex transport system ATP-binding protein